jgi:hypothetical protein
LEAVFAKRAGIAWSDIERMLIHYGAELSEGSGSRVRIALNGVRAVFHRPHRQKETDRGGQWLRCGGFSSKPASSRKGNRNDVQGL